MRRTIHSKYIMTNNDGTHTCISWTSDNNGAFVCKVCGSECPEDEK